MNLTDNFKMMVDGSRSLFKSWAHFNSIPSADWKPQSFSGVHIAVEPDTDVKQLLDATKKYKVVSLTQSQKGFEIIFTNATTVLVVTNCEGTVGVEIARNDLGAQEEAEDLRRILTPHALKNTEEDGVWAEFTHLTPNGVSRSRQFLKCPKWNAISGNYMKDTREGVADLMALKSPWDRGRLVIWSGEPGTGKTYALRSLMMTWRDRFQFIVVTDPENLTSRPEYYFEVAGESTEKPRRYYQKGFAPARFHMEGEEDEEQERKKRVLFILEDSADLILPESRGRHFDKIGKLLNITDGLFGQGREDLFLVTFNEKIDKVDPAFLRPGRCITRTEFRRFEAENADKWLKDHKTASAPLCASADYSLAELYERLYKGAPKVEPQQKGFAPIRK